MLLLKFLLEHDMNRMHNPTHPGEILQDIWPEGLTLTAAANQIGVARANLANILNGSARITGEIACQLHNWGGISAERWLRMQNAYDAWTEKRHRRANQAFF
jgi:addiction module HigA family antidote